ncbi:alpha/beta hydrolase [Mumia sp. DW29H23]|uniref:alpha/beta hydrolase n=1 Tax=Mumia sp. DW29H23 TaxID=3421241 RepID=UPI003D699DE5
MPHHPIPRSTPRRRRTLVALFAALTLVLGLGSVASAAPPHKKPSSAPKPTVVLVHGAFADASGWADVTKKLQKKGYTVYAPANPLRSLSGDSAYIRAFLETIPGPVVLVGHSYGGAVITNAATGNANVKSLVYVAAFAPDAGETVAAASELGGGHSELLANIVTRPYPGAGPQDADAYINPSSFRALFAADLPAKETAVMAAAQRPATFTTFLEPSGEPAWKTIPSWYLVAENDKTIPPEAERAMAARAGARTVEIRSSHVAMISHPKAVTDLILRAAR